MQHYGDQLTQSLQWRIVHDNGLCKSTELTLITFLKTGGVAEKIKTKDYCEWPQTSENISVEARFPNKYDDHD